MLIDISLNCSLLKINIVTYLLQIDDAVNEIANAANYQNVRLFRAGKDTSFTPLYDLAEVEIQWTRPNESTVKTSLRFYCVAPHETSLSNIIVYYPYRAFGGQNKIVYSTHFVTRRAIILLLPGLCDNERNTIIIVRAIICDLNSARR